MSIQRYDHLHAGRGEWCRWDDLPRWRTVAEDGMPPAGTLAFVTSPAQYGDVLESDGELWRMPVTRAGRSPMQVQRYLILSELKQLPGGGDG